MVEDSDRFDRRTVLKTATTAALFGLGTAATSGSASAAEARRLQSSYADEESLRTALQRHAGGVVDQLHEAGIVDEEFDLDAIEFGIDDEIDGVEPSADDRLASVTATRADGDFTALGGISTSSDTHEIALYVQPERGLAFARAQPHGGDDTIKVTEDDVTTEGCAYTSCESTGTCSSDCYEEKYYYSCDSSCQNCSVYKTDCSCCICDSEDC